MLYANSPTKMDTFAARFLPASLTSRGNEALRQLALIDTRYEGLTRGLLRRQANDSDGRLRQLEHRQMRERISFERQFTAAHETMSELILDDLTSVSRA